MKIIKRGAFTVLVPEELPFLCSVEDKERWERETAAGLEDVAPIYRFEDAYVPEQAKVEDYEGVFMEIGPEDEER